MSGLFGGSSDVSSQGLARELGRDSTLSAVDLAKIDQVNSSLNQLVFTFQKAKQQALAGGISISSITASSSQADSRNPVTLSADIGGDNIGYIYLFAGYYDPRSNSIFAADQDYIESPDTLLVKGIYYPDWGKGEFTLDFSWEPSFLPSMTGQPGYTPCSNRKATGAASQVRRRPARRARSLPPPATNLP